MGNKHSGRKARPTALTALAGNPGKRALKVDIALARPETAPACPSWLQNKAKTMYKRLAKILVELDLFTLADVEMLAGYCQSYTRYREAEQAIEDHGLLITETSAAGCTRLVANPAVRISRGCLADAIRIAASFGFSPSDRLKEPASSSKETDPLTAIMQNRMRSNQERLAELQRKNA